ncbi:MAG: methionyl-tRNA formyltransferase [Patescibacteria group bacterium]
MSYSIVFFGTSDFAVPSLKALLADQRFDVKAVVTQPDQPVGRHQVMTAPPIKVTAQENKLAVFQFEKIKDTEALKTLADFKADFFVVASYGQIIPQSVLDLPNIGPINVHGSLLPKWRGASCVQSAIAAGDKEAGITIMLMDALMDHGPIISQTATEILADDTGESLHDRLAELGARNLPDVLNQFAQGKLKPVEQDHTKATACKLLKRDDGKIDWSKSAEEIERLIRAYNPWPSAWMISNKKRIKILKTRILGVLKSPRRHGEIFAQDEKLVVNCGDNKALEILELQPEGKKAMTAKQFLAGNHSF